MHSPYLSIVVASRNDNHGGDMTRRMRLFINGLIYQCNKFKLPAELLFVEWNPPAGALLKDVLPKPTKGDYLTLRYIEVPAETHNRYLLGQRIPLFQMTAKNVGIRRARAEFILCTNVDLLFNDALIAELAERKLQTGKFYRCNRCDVPKDIPENVSVEEQLDWCSKTIMVRHGLVETPKSQFKRLLKPILNRFNTMWPQLASTDYVACGDFTLMSKADWLKIEGYAELDLYSIHIDSMALNACIAQDIEQVVYPPALCAYHIYHEEGWAAMGPLKALHFLALRPGIDWSVMQQAGQHIIHHKTNYGINTPDWGFANEKFEEHVFNSFE
jgi:hypothetical protein